MSDLTPTEISGSLSTDLSVIWIEPKSNKQCITKCEQYIHVGNLGRKIVVIQIRVQAKSPLLLAWEHCYGVSY